MSTRLLSMIAAGLLGALVFVSAAFVPVFGLAFGQFSPAILMAMGLAQGPLAPLIGGLAGALALTAFGGGVLGIVFLVADVLPAVVLARLALRNRVTADGSVVWYPPGPLLAWLTATGAGLVLAAGLFTLGGGYAATIEDTLAMVLQQILPPAQVDDAQLRDTAAAWGTVLPGMLAASWLFRAVASGMLAQWAVTRLGRARRPAPRYIDTFLPPALAGALAVALLAGWLLPGDIGYAARNAALVLAAPYLVQGLTVIHKAARSTRRPRGWLTAFYVVFLFASGLAVVAMIGLGLVDNLTRLRSHRSGARRQEEE